MYIGMVCPYSLSVPGGVQGQVFGLARALRSRGHVVQIIAPADGPTTEGGVMVVGQSVMNAANETAAAAFLAGEIGFLDIPTVIRRTMTRHRAVPVREIEDVLEADRAAREFSVRLCRDLTR